MKNTCLLFVLFLSAVICLSPSCKKKADEPEISQLPAITQTGANTFGCLVNGVAFLPHTDSFLNSSHDCNYIYLNGGYYLTLSASNQTASDYSESIVLGTTNLPIAEGQTIKLDNYNESGKAFGKYFIVSGSTAQVNSYYTSTTITGELRITKFDQVNQIISGTFFFDAANKNGETKHVTDGRFDMKYTQ